MKFLFFFSLFMVFYVYLGYPLLIFLIALIRNKKVRKAPIQPSVTILIAAYNEERDIEKTIKNKLELDYPKEKLEIIVISDGSTDNTDEIVKKYEGEQVRLIRQKPRAGKTSALNLAVPQAKGEIIAFSDANSLWEKSALLKLAENFNDPSVGYVTGKMVYTNPDGSMVGDGCTTYMKYENRLREVETKIGSIVGVDGGIDAVRKNTYHPMNPDQLPDFVLPLKVVQQGYRVVYDSEAILKEASLKDSKDEYRMRVRVSLRALWALWDMRSLLVPGWLRSRSLAPSSLHSFSPSALFAWQLWSHKILRYCAFLFLAGAYALNLALWPEGWFYKAIFVAQNVAYLLAATYPLLTKVATAMGRLYFLNYFLLLNLAAGHAFLKFLVGKKQVVWTPRKG
jgi:cellulose synthase/poly-beta-1,6-N-acetylglucosamine synthase-like glycosyltransferase